MDPQPAPPVAPEEEQQPQMIETRKCPFPPERPEDEWWEWRWGHGFKLVPGPDHPRFLTASSLSFGNDPIPDAWCGDADAKKKFEAKLAAEECKFANFAAMWEPLGELRFREEISAVAAVMLEEGRKREKARGRPSDRLLKNV